MCRRPIVKKYREGTMKRTHEMGVKKSLKQFVIGFGANYEKKTKTSWK